MRKRILLGLFGLCLLFVGCSREPISKSYVGKGKEEIKVTLDNPGNLTLSDEAPFSVSKGKEVVSTGMFVHEGVYGAYTGVFSNGKSYKVLEEGEKDGNLYIFYEQKVEDISNLEKSGKEGVENKSETSVSQYNYVVKIKDSNNCVLIVNNTSRSSAKKVFNKLTFSLEN